MDHESEINIYTIQYNKNVTSSVKINNMHTDLFTCTDGLRQGDSLSPVLYAMSINDLSKMISEVDKDRNMDICYTQMI